LDEKEPFWNDIWRAFPGHPGVETLVPLLLNEVLEGHLSWERAIAVCAERPARIFGFYPRKGAILPGADADLFLFDPNGEWQIDRNRLFTKARANARLYDGLTLRGKVTRTLVRGATVYQDGQIVGSEGHGRFIRPS
jgi:dihydroorotase-like cyclic amidohydrolase